MKKQESFKGMPIYYWNARKTAFVVYNQYDMGNKYKVYTVRKNDDNSTYKHYEIAFESPIKAYNYTDMIY